MKFLYITKEKYPTYRVDLTELFSVFLIQKGYSIDWHMNSTEANSFKNKKSQPNENFILSDFDKGSSLKTKIKNRLNWLVHDFAINKSVKSNNYDFIQVRDTIFSALIALYIARRQRIPFFYWLSFPHSEAEIYRVGDMKGFKALPKALFHLTRGYVSKFLLYNLIMKKADFVFVQSDRMLQDMVSRGIGESKMYPVPMGINISEIKISDNYQNIKSELENTKPLIYLGTMVRERRIEILIEMMPKILSQFPDAVLLLVGDAPKSDMKYLKNKTIELGVSENVIFTGFIPMEKAWHYVRASVIGLSPFRPSPILDSTSPTKLVEYMALEKPVVANNHPDQTKVINESMAGYVVDYDSNSFADACIKLLKDPENSLKMGKLGLEYVRSNRTYEIISEKLIAKYCELLKAV